MEQSQKTQQSQQPQQSTTSPTRPKPELHHLSTKARKYIRLLCATDFKSKLSSLETSLSPSNESKRVSFSSNNRHHSWTRNVSILQGSYPSAPEGESPGCESRGTKPNTLQPSASKSSPTSSILKKSFDGDLELGLGVGLRADLGINPGINQGIEPHTPPKRRSSFPRSRQTIQNHHLFTRLSSLVQRRKQRLSSPHHHHPNDPHHNFNDIPTNELLEFFNFTNLLTPLPFPTNPHGPPLRRNSSPEIDLICPFEHPDDRAVRLDTPSLGIGTTGVGSSSSEKVRKFSLTRGSLEVVRGVGKKVRRVSGGKLSGSGPGSEDGKSEKSQGDGKGGKEGGDKREEKGFYGPLWTKKYDLDLPRSIRPDDCEIAYLIRIQKEERERVRAQREARESPQIASVLSTENKLKTTPTSEIEIIDLQEGEISEVAIEPRSRIPLDHNSNSNSNSQDEEKKCRQRIATLEAQITYSINNNEEPIQGRYRDGWSGRGFRIWPGNGIGGWNGEEVGVWTGRREEEEEVDGKGEDDEDVDEGRKEDGGVKWRIPVY